jgi:hypothetical protein
MSTNYAQTMMNAWTNCFYWNKVCPQGTTMVTKENKAVVIAGPSYVLPDGSCVVMLEKQSNEVRLDDLRNLTPDDVVDFKKMTVTQKTEE